MNMTINGSATAVCSISTCVELDPRDYIGYDDEEEVISELMSLIVDNCYSAGDSHHDLGSSYVDEVYDDTVEISENDVQDFLDEWRELKNTTRDDE